MRKISILILVFISLLSQGFAEEIRIGFGSCVNEYDPKIWEAANKLDLDAFILLGDTVYLKEKDFSSLRDALSKYKSLYGHKEFLDFSSKVPVYAQWDDHDFGTQDTDSNFPHKKITTEAFKQFWNTRPYNKAVPGSIAGSLKIKNIRLVFTDNRSFRINSEDIEKRRLFGKEQLRWIEKILKTPDAEIVLLFSSNQVLSNQTVYESVAQHPVERIRIIDAVRDSPAHVLIISGDRHFAEVLTKRVRSELVYELSSSPMAAPVTPSEKIIEEKNRQGFYNGGTNFGVIVINTDNSTWAFKLYNNAGEQVLRFSSEAVSLH